MSFHHRRKSTAGFAGLLVFVPSADSTESTVNVLEESLPFGGHLVLARSFPWQFCGGRRRCDARRRAKSQPGYENIPEERDDLSLPSCRRNEVDSGAEMSDQSHNH